MASGPQDELLSCPGSKMPALLLDFFGGITSDKPDVHFTVSNDSNLFWQFGTWAVDNKNPCDIPCTSWLIGILTSTYLGSITSCDKLPTRASIIACNSLALHRWFHWSQPWHFRMLVLIRRLTYLILPVLSISEEICPTILMEEIDGLHLHSHVRVQYYKNPFEVIFISTGQLSFFHQCTSCTTNSNPKSLMPTKGLWNHLWQRFWQQKFCLANLEAPQFHEDFGLPKIWKSSPSSSLYINQYYPVEKTRSDLKKGREKTMDP